MVVFFIWSFLEVCTLMHIMKKKFYSIKLFDKVLNLFIQLHFIDFYFSNLGVSRFQLSQGQIILKEKVKFTSLKGNHSVVMSEGN